MAVAVNPDVAYIASSKVTVFYALQQVLCQGLVCSQKIRRDKAVFDDVLV